ncbi:MAG: hypothetical protein EYC68_05310 [Chloroflexota bacterium]|nr:MAG: hypothetical protein EYC68_05310 [Chloroflexota bacterium]
MSWLEHSLWSFLLSFADGFYPSQFRKLRQKNARKQERKQRMSWLEHSLWSFLLSFADGFYPSEWVVSIILCALCFLLLPLIFNQRSPINNL